MKLDDCLLPIFALKMQAYPVNHQGYSDVFLSKYMGKMLHTNQHII